MPWPDLSLPTWPETRPVLHMYTQVVGKVRLALSPMENHWWQVPLYVTTRGLTTSPIPYADSCFQLDFDLFDHQLVVQTSEGEVRRIALGSSVKVFYADVMRTLGGLGIQVRMQPRPSEVADPIPFTEDDRATYDPAAAHRFWEVLRRVDSVLRTFRAGFVGKSSPVHFFWGSFDLAVTRFSGRPADPPPGADPMTRIGYNAELSSVGFWPGGGGVEGAAFYAYTSPKPAGLEDQPVRPQAAAFYDAKLGEFLLMYDAVRSLDDPAAAILDFAQSTYEAGARLQGWRIEELRLQTGMPQVATS
jgi:Family of unknown function (DUF5996)